MSNPTTTPSGNISETPPLIGEDASGRGYFIANQGLTEFNVPKSLFINDRAKTNLTNEQFLEKWQKAFDPASVFESFLTSARCSLEFCEILHPAAAIEIDSLSRERSLHALQLQEHLKGNALKETKRMLYAYGVEPTSTSHAEIDDTFPCLTTSEGIGYFLAKWGPQSLCIRNDPMQSGISNADLSDLLEDAFPVGTIQASQASTGQPRWRNAEEERFLNSFLSENRVQLYLPVVHSSQREALATGTLREANVLSILHF